MKYYLILLVFIATASHAEVYRTIDEHGNTVYSDVKTDSAEEIIIDIAPSYTPLAIPEVVEEEATGLEKVTEKVSYKLNIASPLQDETIRDNAGNVTVSINMTPELDLENGDSLIFTLDGKQSSKREQSTSYTFENIDRGSHIAVVKIVDKSGKSVKKSKSILFHLQRIVPAKKKSPAKK